jgi:hypothetical protein
VLSTDAHHFLGCDHALSISGFEGPLIGLDEPKTIGVQIESIYSIALLPESGVKTLLAGRIAADNTTATAATRARPAQGDPAPGGVGGLGVGGEALPLARVDRLLSSPPPEQF